MLTLGSIFTVASNIGLPLIFLIVMIETGCGIPAAPGEIAWAISVALFGYFVGSTAVTIMNDLGVYGIVFVLIGVVGVFVVIKRQRQRLDAAIDDQGSSFSLAPLAVPDEIAQPTEPSV